METTATALLPPAWGIAGPQRVRWDIGRDVIRGRTPDVRKPFLPPGLSLVDELPFLAPADRLLLGHVQGRTYAWLLDLCERFTGARRLRPGQLRRLAQLLGPCMPAGHEPTSDPDAMTQIARGKSSWAVLALSLVIELSALAHYRCSLQSAEGLCALWKDVLLARCKEESRHAALDELEFLREDARLSAAQRDRGVNDLIALMGAMEGIVSAQSDADARYFLANASGRYDPDQRREAGECLLKAYRWQHLMCGVMEPPFQRLLFGAIDLSQVDRISQALRPLMDAVPRRPAGGTH